MVQDELGQSMANVPILEGRNNSRALWSLRRILRCRLQCIACSDRIQAQELGAGFKKACANLSSSSSSWLHRRGHSWPRRPQKLPTSFCAQPVWSIILQPFAAQAGPNTVPSWVGPPVREPVSGQQLQHKTLATACLRRSDCKAPNSAIRLRCRLCKTHLRHVSGSQAT